MVKNEHHHWILHIQIILGSTFQLKLTTSIFWTKFSQKAHLQSKPVKVTTDNLEFLQWICAKRMFPVEESKSEINSWNLHIQISLGTKFHLKLKISIFWTEMTQKGYFWLKTEKVNIKRSQTFMNCRYQFLARTESFSGPNYLIKIFSASIWKSDYHRWIMYTRIKKRDFCAKIKNLYPHH